VFTLKYPEQTERIIPRNPEKEGDEVGKQIVNAEVFGSYEVHQKIKNS
jgi:hypothetical protein